MQYPTHLISIAPMMDWTDRHCRYFLRLISQHVLLYTEMVTIGALLHGDSQRFLAYHPAEHPLAIQLGGSNPAELAACAQLAEQAGFIEVNLNVGCPSDRVQAGRFGACLMAEPGLVADCVAAMTAAVKIPITVKTRIGIDDKDSYAELAAFIDTVATAGCSIFIVHARKAWLHGLSPKENREIPPLDYERVYQLKRDFPHLTFVINGGIKTVTDIQTHLHHVDGVMIGREAYQNPYSLAPLDALFFADNTCVRTRAEVVTALLPYIEHELTIGTPLSVLIRPIFGLFNSQPRGKLWRRYLSEKAHITGAGCEVVEQGLRVTVG